MVATCGGRATGQNQALARHSSPALRRDHREVSKGIRRVDLFLSTFENRIDKKGRLSVPAPFRAVLERRRDPLYLFKSLTEPCLEGCGPERIGQIVDAIDSMDSLSAEVATLQTMLSSAQEMKLDGEGRMMLSGDFIAASANVGELDPALRADEIATARIDNAGLDTILSNSFGFGGTNATLVFQRFEG